MRKINPVAVIFLVFGLLLFAANWYIKNHVAKPLPEAATKTVEFTGKVEVRQQSLHFQTPGKVGDVLVSVGDVVEKDQTVARLDNQELVDEVALLKKKVQDAQAELETMLSGLAPETSAPAAVTPKDEDLETKHREEISVAETAVAHARDEMETMRLEVARYEKMFKEGTAPEKELQKAKSDFETAKAQVKEAEEMLRVVKQAPPVEPPPPTKVALVKAAPKVTMAPAGKGADVQQRLAQAKAALAQAEEKLRLAEVVAPFPGHIMERSLDPGEFTVAGTQVATIGKLDPVWIWGYVDGEDGAAIKKGMEVLVSSRSLQEKVFSGKVVHVAAPKQAPQGADAKPSGKKGSYHIKVAVPNPDLHLQPGMEANVTIEMK